MLTYLTIDTEYSAAFVRARGRDCRAENFDRAIDGRTAQGRFGVAHQIERLDAHGELGIGPRELVHERGAAQDDATLTKAAHEILAVEAGQGRFLAHHDDEHADQGHTHVGGTGNGPARVPRLSSSGSADSRNTFSFSGVMMVPGAMAFLQPQPTLDDLLEAANRLAGQLVTFNRALVGAPSKVNPRPAR